MPSLRRLPIRLAAVLACVGLLGIYLYARQQNARANQGQENAQADRESGYEVLAKGVVSSRPFPVQFRSAPLRLEFRNLIMGRGESEPITAPTNILMELREGGVTTTINQQASERRQGDFWVVEKGSSLLIKNPGEVAVIRAIYMFEGNQ